MGACGCPEQPPPGEDPARAQPPVEIYLAAEGGSLQQEIRPEQRQFLLQQTPRVCALFIAKVNAILTVQMVLISLVSLPFTFLMDRDTLSEQVWLYCAALLSMVVLVAATSLQLRGAVRAYPWNLGFLCALTVFMGIVTGFACAMYVLPAVAFAVAIVAAICGALASYAWFTGTDFMGFMPYVFAVSCGLTLLGVLLIFVDADIGQKLAGGATATAFCLYVVRNSQLMAGGQHGGHFTVGDYLFATICIYLDMMSPFQRMAKMVMGTRSL